MQSEYEDNPKDRRSTYIHLSTPRDISPVLTQASSYEKYIILQNDKLNEEIIHLRDEIDTLQEEHTELEEENRKYSVAQGYTKHLLRNLVVLENLHKKVSNIHVTMYKSHVKRITSSFDRMSRYINYTDKIVLCMLMIMFKFGYNVFYFYIFLMCYFGVSVSSKYVSKWVTTSLFSEDTKILKTDVAKLEKEIKEIRDSQDFLDEYITNIGLCSDEPAK